MRVYCRCYGPNITFSMTSGQKRIDYGNITLTKERGQEIFQVRINGSSKTDKLERHGFESHNNFGLLFSSHLALVRDEQLLIILTLLEKDLSNAGQNDWDSKIC